MDQGTLGAIATVLVFVAFLGVCWWAFSPKRKKRFDEDAQLPFADETDAQDPKRSSQKAADHSDSNDEQAQDNQADRHKGDAERQD